MHSVLRSTHHISPECPLIVEDVHQSDGHREQVEQQVGDGEVDDENVSRIRQCLRSNIECKNINVLKETIGCL